MGINWFGISFIIFIVLLVFGGIYLGSKEDDSYDMKNW